MKTHATTIFLSLALGLIGGISGQYLFPDFPVVEQTTENFDSLSELMAKIDQLQKKTKLLEAQLTEISKSQSQSKNKPEYTNTEGTIVEETIASISPIGNPETSNRDNLVSAGIDPDLVDDILQRICHLLNQPLPGFDRSPGIVGSDD